MANTGQNVNDIKISNRSLLLNLLYFDGPQSRKVLAQKSKLTAAAVTMIVNELILDGCVTETDLTVLTGRSGRKEELIDINYKSLYVFGVRIENGQVIINLSGLDSKILATKSISFSDIEYSSLWLDIALIIKTMLSEEHVSIENVVGIGVTVRGIVDNDNGISIDSYGILHSNCQISYELSKHLELPVYVENNVRAMLIADIILRHAKPVQSTLFVKFGPGIGGALLIGQKSYTGSNYRAIELGHVCVKENGDRCICGKNGCLETLVSYESIIKNARIIAKPEDAPVLFANCNADKTDLTIEKIMIAYEFDDPGVVFIIDHVIKQLALAISNFAVLFNPEIVLLCSENFRNKRFLEDFQREISKHEDSNAKYLISTNTNKLNINGAQATAINHFLTTGGQKLRLGKK